MAGGLDDDSVLALAAGSASQRAAALNALVDEHGKRMLSYVKRIVAERVGESLVLDLSREIYQETWLQVSKSAVTGILLDIPANERPKYIFGICRKVASERFRQFKRAPSMVTYEDDIAQAKQTLVSHGIDPERREVITALLECIEKLTGQTKTVFKLRHMNNTEPLTSRDIGATLQIADTTARAYLKQGTDSVKDCMRRKGYADNIHSKEPKR